jgi:hypothetical protein
MLGKAPSDRHIPKVILLRLFAITAVMLGFGAVSLGAIAGVLVSLDFPLPLCLVAFLWVIAIVVTVTISFRAAMRDICLVRRGALAPAERVLRYDFLDIVDGESRTDYHYEFLVERGGPVQGPGSYRSAAQAEGCRIEPICYRCGGGHIYRGSLPPEHIAVLYRPEDPNDAEPVNGLPPSVQALLASEVEEVTRRGMPDGLLEARARKNMPGIVRHLETWSAGLDHDLVANALSTVIEQGGLDNIGKAFEATTRHVSPRDATRGHLAYNLASCAAVLRRKDEMLDWLRAAERAGDSPQDALTDPDFRDFWDDEDLRRLAATDSPAGRSTA